MSVLIAPRWDLIKFGNLWREDGLSRDDRDISQGSKDDIFLINLAEIPDLPVSTAGGLRGRSNQSFGSCSLRVQLSVLWRRPGSKKSEFGCAGVWVMSENVRGRQKRFMWR